MNELLEDLKFQLSHGAIKSTEEYLQNYPHLLEEIENIFNFKYLESFIDQPFQEIILRNDLIYIKDQNQRSSYKLQANKHLVDRSFQILAYKHNIIWNEKSPFQSFATNLCHKYVRLSLLNSSIGTKTHQYFIRSINDRIFELQAFTNCTKLLIELIQNKSNILIAGSSGSGKTSLINSLLKYIDPLENLIILEDTQEIVSTHKHISRMNSKDSEKLKEYCSYAVRMNPDRIILGEMRSHEVLPYILAANSGVRGMISSIHANSALDSLHRVAQLFDLYSQHTSITHEQTLKFICKNIDFVCFMDKGKITQIIKVLNYHTSNIIFEDVSLL